MTKELNISRHAISRYSIRTGTPLHKALMRLRSDINNARPVTAEEACKYFSMTRVEEACNYLMWENKTINELLLAIIRDRTVVTVLSQNMLASPTRRARTSRIINCNGQFTRLDPWLVRESVQLGQFCLTLKNKGGCAL